jgi:quinol monooxygenase YgiN
MAKRAAKKSTIKPKIRKVSARRRASSKDGKLSKEAVTLMVLLRSHQGQETLLAAELRALVGPTRREDGCIRYDLHCRPEAPGTFLLHEVWASREHHRLHTLTPHFIRWDARKDALLASRDVAFWTQLM